MAQRHRTIISPTDKSVSALERLFGYLRLFRRIYGRAAFSYSPTILYFQYISAFQY